MARNSRRTDDDAGIYDDPRWRRLSARHKRSNPWCAVAGCEERADHVDHIVPRRRAPARFLDPTNLQSLCHAHHNRLTRAFDLGTIRGACDVDGNTLDPSHPWAQPDQASAIRAANAKPPPTPAALAARLKQQTVRGQRR